MSRDNTGVENTCQYLDEVIGNAESLIEKVENFFNETDVDDLTQEKLNEVGNEIGRFCCALSNCFGGNKSTIEKAWAAHYALRTLANEKIDEVDELEKNMSDQEHRIAQLQEDLDEANERIGELESQLQ